MSSEDPVRAAIAPRRHLKEHLRARRRSVERLRRDLIALLEAENAARQQAARAPAQRVAASRGATAMAPKPQSAAREAIRAARGELRAVRSFNARLR